jgi:anaerobic magnesium-protoporphyrin IX monomethyl ester cyclase
MAHVTFMVPFDPDSNHDIATKSMPPLRLAYLAATCRRAGHQVTVVDGVGLGLQRQWSWTADFPLRGLEFDELIARIPADCTVLGISMLFSRIYPPVRELVRRIRAARADLFIVLGGEGCTSLGEFILSETPADAVVAGEGERPMLRILERISDGQAVDGIPNVITRRTAIVDAKDNRSLAIDDIPAPDWDGIPLDAYWEDGRAHGVAVSRRFLPLIVSRGCPYSCRFCTAPSTWVYQRYGSIEKTIDQLREQRDTYGVDYFIFNDLSITTNIKWFEAFVDRLIEANLGIRWALPSGVRAQRLSVELLRKCKQSGLVFLQISPETGSEQVMNWLEKAMSLPSIEATVRNAKAAGLPVSACFIVGLPVEQWDDYIDTLRSMRTLGRLGLDDVSMCLFVPFPGSPSFIEQQRTNPIPLTDAYFSQLNTVDYHHQISHSPHFDGEQLLLMRLFAYLWFYGYRFLRTPQHLLAATFRAASGRQAQRIDRVLRHDLLSVARAFLPLLSPTAITMGLRIAGSLWQRAWRPPAPPPTGGDPRPRDAAPHELPVLPA